MKVKTKSPANIAFIKYWGKTNPRARVPQNNSISMCLSEMFSECEVEFRDDLKKDEINFVGEKVVKKKEIERIVEVLDRVRKLGKTKLRARVVTKNNFPKATGIASSASGMSALTLAALSSLGIKMSQRELSKLSRLASGTACRSISDGFVEWVKGENADSSYAKQLFMPDYWQICDVVAIVTKEMKKVSSTEGHALAETSPFYETRLRGMDKKIKEIKRAMKEKNFSEFGKIIEAEALSMHAVCITSVPSIIYWNKTTLTIIKKVMEWRKGGEIESYFTIDAGPSVHVICREKDSKKIAQRLRIIEGVKEVVINNPGIGVRVVST
ncbi:MAG: diphosphomevalonate decarboxylase [Candidatus Beckwithbacteria bacterium]|nr:diphosphomevalonate decarboxylase [Patescibacteria group bacterium]